MDSAPSDAPRDTKPIGTNDFLYYTRRCERHRMMFTTEYVLCPLCEAEMRVSQRQSQAESPQREPG